MLLDASKTRPVGELIFAEVASLYPSPSYPAVPVPAMVVINAGPVVPAVTEYFRMRWLLVSAMYRAPKASTTTADGKFNLALVPAIASLL